MEKIRKNLSDKLLWQFAAILLGALLMGFLWRVRGSHGWGSSWGLLNAGFIFTMFIILIKGVRQKLSFPWLGVLSFSFMLTTPSWGTLLDSITGVLFTADEVAEIPSLAGGDVYCSVFSAVFMMLCLGFGLASLFGILLGAAYSEKQWKIKDYIILLVVFFAVDLITKATVSQWILGAIQPQAVDVFEKGLEATGLEGDAWKTYLQHFDDYSWSKKIIGGRNYFASVETISLALKALASIIATRFIIKDKTAAKTGLAVCSAFAAAITVSDLFFYFCDGGYHMLGQIYEGDFIAAWSCWEYFTGFIAGGIITAFILNAKPEKDLPDLAFKKIPCKAKTVIGFLLSYGLLIGVAAVRPIIERFDEGKWQIPAIIIAVVATVAIIIPLVKKWGLCGEKTDMEDIASLLLPIFVFFDYIVYMYLGVSDYPNSDAILQLQNIMVGLSELALLIAIMIYNIKRKKD